MIPPQQSDPNQYPPIRPLRHQHQLRQERYPFNNLNGTYTKTPPSVHKGISQKVSSDGSGSNKSLSFKENFRPGNLRFYVIKNNFELGNDRCPRCNDRVYYAEKVVANGINWHKVIILWPL